MQEDQKNIRAIKGVSYILVGIAIAIFAYLSWRIISTQSNFIKMFADMGVAKPLVTRIVLSTWFAAIGPIAAIALLAKEIYLKKPRWCLYVNVASLALAEIYWQIYTQGVTAPMLTVIEGMQ